MTTILLVEDERPIRSMLGFALSKAGFKTLEAENGQQVWQSLDESSPDLILMDWMLPDATGIELTQYLKSKDDTRNIPIIMLTAKSEEEDKIMGLNAGADDYVCKPFSPKELIARINAVLRRNQYPATNDNQLTTKDMILDVNCHRVSIKDEVIELGPTEFRLLHFLMQNPKRVYSRDMLLNQVWGRNKYVEERTVDVHILRLRRALAQQGYDKTIQTVHGIGYRFSPNELT